MATLVLRKTNERITGEENVKTFLDEQGVLYEHWDTNKLPQELWDKFILSDEDKEKILEVFDVEIETIAQKHGYKNWDIVALSDATPNLDELLIKRSMCILKTKFGPSQPETGSLQLKEAKAPDTTILN